MSNRSGSNKTNSFAAKLPTKKIILSFTLLSILLFVLGDKIIFDLSTDNTTLFVLESTKSFLFILLAATILYYLLNLYTKTFLEVSQDLEQHSLALSKEYQQNLEKLQQLSIHDKLTGLTNRTYFEFQLERLQDTQHFPVGVIVCDVEYLKLFNDTLGHVRGDKTLLNAVSLLKNSFPAAFSISRIGSSEFIIFFKNTSLQQIEAAYANLREQETAYNKANPISPVSFSLGLAVSENSESKLHEIFSKADYAMYSNKLDQSKEVRELFLQAILLSLREHDTATHSHFTNLPQLIEKFALFCNLSAQTVQELKWLATFHDIGKIGISNKILSKQGQLTPEESSEIRKHSNIGYNIARITPSLMPIADLINKHHEWWNGQGYPLGLKGSQIPLECRILAIVDAFDAMTKDRPYRTAMPLGAALQEIEKCAGSQFDPELAEKFIELMQKEVSG